MSTHANFPANHATNRLAVFCRQIQQTVTFTAKKPDKEQLLAMVTQVDFGWEGGRRRGTRWTEGVSGQREKRVEGRKGEGGVGGGGEREVYTCSFLYRISV